MIKDLYPKLKEGNLPTVVWMFDVKDDRMNKRLDGTIFQNETVGLALKRFNCYKVDVRNMPDSKLKKQYLRGFGFYFFDPAGKPTMRPLVGRHSGSLSSFEGYVERIWDHSFTLRFRTYQRKMKDVLDGLDRVENEKKVLVLKQKRLKERPNRRLQFEVKKSQEAIAAQTKKVNEMEKGIMAKCSLKPDYLPAKGGETAKR